MPARSAATAILLVIAGCATAPPRDPDDACRIFSDNTRWYRDALRAEEHWGLPPAMALAFVHRESSYTHDAKPPRGRLLWVSPWRRPSSAYGYAQATDEAWSDYRRATNSWLAERDDFGDALDFIGWYNDRSHRALGIAKSDAYRLYLAYHEGPTGYRRGGWRNKSHVKSYAAKVDERYRRYTGQLRRCSSTLDRGGWF
jgi:hypothetical protein